MSTQRESDVFAWPDAPLAIPILNSEEQKLTFSANSEVQKRDNLSEANDLAWSTAPLPKCLRPQN